MTLFRTTSDSLNAVHVQYTYMHIHMCNGRTILKDIQLLDPLKIVACPSIIVHGISTECTIG